MTKSKKSKITAGKEEVEKESAAEGSMQQFKDAKDTSNTST